MDISHDQVLNMIILCLCSKVSLWLPLIYFLLDSLSGRLCIDYSTLMAPYLIITEVPKVGCFYQGMNYFYLATLFFSMIPTSYCFTDMETSTDKRHYSICIMKSYEIQITICSTSKIQPNLLSPRNSKDILS